MSLDREFKSSAQQAYEERLLFMLFLLRQPHIRMIYVTSQPIHPSIIDYYLQILPGVVISNARKRLFLVSPLDGSSRPLTLKLLERPRLIRQIQSLVPNLDLAHIVPYNTTDLERELAVRLNIPMYGADPQFFNFGTKSGGRRIFADEGVPHPLGAENLGSEAEVLNAIHHMRAQRAQKSALRRVLIKLNEGVSGEGNAIVNLEGLSPPGDPAEAAVISERIRSMQFEASDTDYETFIAKLV